MKKVIEFLTALRCVKGVRVYRAPENDREYSCRDGILLIELINGTRLLAGPFFNSLGALFGPGETVQAPCWIGVLADHGATVEHLKERLDAGSAIRSLVRRGEGVPIHPKSLDDLGEILLRLSHYSVACPPGEPHEAEVREF